VKDTSQPARLWGSPIIKMMGAHASLHHCRSKLSYRSGLTHGNAASASSPRRRLEGKGKGWHFCTHAVCPAPCDASHGSWATALGPSTKLPSAQLRSCGRRAAATEPRGASTSESSKEGMKHLHDPP
jgi:hypothetical protein